MKALVVTTAPPDATTAKQTGSTNWTLRLLRLLDQHHEITLLAPPPLDEPYLQQAHFTQLECPPDNRFGTCNRFLKSFLCKVYPSMWHQRSSKIDDFLTHTSRRQFDVCWLLDDYAGMYLKQIPIDLPVVFCRHFVLNMGLPEKAANTTFTSWIKLRWHKYLARSFDRWTTLRTNVVITGTKESRKNLLALEPKGAVVYFPTKPCHTPKSTPIAKIEKSTRQDGRITAIFLGDMTFPRNVDAINWLTEKVLPLLAPQEQAAFHFKFIGRYNHCNSAIVPPGDLSLEYTGFVEDLHEHLSHAQCAAIPVFGGNGVRVKTVTLLGSGLPTVSTSDGVEGLPVVSGKDLIIADTPESFAEGLRTLLSPDKRLLLANNCRDTMGQFLSEENDSEKLFSISRETCKKSE